MEKYVNKIFVGHMNSGAGQSLYHDYKKISKNKAELSSVVVTDLDSSICSIAIIENPENYYKIILKPIL